MIPKRRVSGWRPGAALPLMALVLAGCAQYKWVHPKLPERAADKAKMQCESEALQLYPVTIAYDVYGGGKETQGTECKAGVRGANCSGGGSKTTLPTVSSRDVNLVPRLERTEACMRVAGWTQVEVPRR